MHLFKVIHPVYRVEAANSAEALRKAKKLVAAGDIRVEKLEINQTFFGMVLFGPK